MPRLLVSLLFVVVFSPVAMAGELLAGIELGGKGVKGTVIEYDPANPGAVTVKESATISTALADLENGKFKEANITKSVDAVQKLMEQFREKHGIPLSKFVFAGSSGIVGTNRDELSAAVQKVTGKPLKYITAEEEVGLTIQGLGLRKQPTPANLDIGGGNTKGGYYLGGEGSKLVSFAEIPGTVALTAKAKAAGGDYPAAVTKVAEDLVSRPLNIVAERDTGWKTQPTIFLTGGSIWAATTYLYPAKVRDPLVPLNRADAEKFLATIAKNPTAFPALDVSGITDANLKADAEKEWKKVQSVYSPENLLAGAEILNRLFQHLPLEGKPTSFARSGSTAWILAYALAESQAAPATPVPATPVPVPAPVEMPISLPGVEVAGPACSPSTNPPVYGPRVRVGLLQRLRGRR